MFRLSLRRKLMFFAIAIAIIPLVVAGRTMIRIAQDELKSSANEQLSSTARQLTGEINDLYEHTWLAPLLLIRNAIDSDELGVQEKVALLTLGIANISDIAALQITIKDSPIPLVVLNEEFGARLEAAGLEPLEALRVPVEEIEAAQSSGEVLVQDVTQVPGTDAWLATVVLPLDSLLAGQESTLSARVDLKRLSAFIAEHPLRKQRGFIAIVNADGEEVFESGRGDLDQFEIKSEAVRFLESGSRLISVEPYANRETGERILAAYSFPRAFDWAVLVGKSEADAYAAINKMIQSLAIWVLGGLVIAVGGAVIFALGISRPILEIDRVAGEVAKGNLRARVQGVRSKDEIGDLGRRMNDMIVGLSERFQLAKFVSGGTLAAIKVADHQGVALGGEKRLATMLFCDIRGYTAFAEKRDPEVVVEVLNFTFQRQADIVSKHHGDIDKFVGDQIVAVLLGDDMILNASLCALEMQDAMAALGREHPDWGLAVGIGITAGEVIMGAMGSSHRMDYTVLGDAVNLAARLCSLAEPHKILTVLEVAETAWPSASFPADGVRIIAGLHEPVAVFDIVDRSRDPDHTVVAEA
ncbi:MAG: adenylate/guanylate cyclase domain-containing protein [Geminicoccaceae bacterium]